MIFDPIKQQKLEKIVMAIGNVISMFVKLNLLIFLSLNFKRSRGIKNHYGCNLQRDSTERHLPKIKK